jgi:hypothetical protein
MNFVKLWSYSVRVPCYKIKRSIPYIRHFKKNEELDTLLKHLYFLRASTGFNEPVEFLEIMKGDEGSKVKKYLTPYTDKMKKIGNTYFFEMCYRENESDRCWVAGLIIDWNL